MRSDRNLAALCRTVAVASLLAGCSAEQPRRAPTEQEVHAADRPALGGIPGRHEFACRDGHALLVDFKDQGNMLELREQPTGVPLVLTAPVQGLQYVGERATVTFDAGELRLQQAGQAERVCKRASP